MELLDKRATPLVVGLLLGLFAVAAGLAVGQTDAEQAQLAARWTARAALPVFLTAYLASSLLRLWPAEWSRAIVRRRRQWGLGFMIAHTIHLGALLVAVLVFGPGRPLLTLLGGGLAYVLIYLMALTSNDWSMKRLGKYWKYLHSFGIHYIWFIFTFSYLGRLAKPETMMTGLIFAPIMFAALGLRLYAYFRARPV